MAMAMAMAMAMVTSRSASFSLLIALYFLSFLLSEAKQGGESIQVRHFLLFLTKKSSSNLVHTSWAPPNLVKPISKIGNLALMNRIL